MPRCASGRWPGATPPSASSSAPTGRTRIAAGLVPADEATRRRLLDLFLIHRVADEIVYEAVKRPTWLWLPVHGLLAMASRRRGAPMSPSKPNRGPSKPKRRTGSPTTRRSTAIVAGTHGDPVRRARHAWRRRRARSRCGCSGPGADGAAVIDCETGDSGRDASTACDPEGFFAGLARRAPRAVRLSPALLPRRRHLGGRGPLSLSADPRRDGRLSHRRGQPPPPVRAARRPSDDARGRRRRRLRASGRPTPRGSASSAISTSGTAAAIPCASASRPASGSSSSPAWPRARSTSSSCSAADGGLLPLKADPFGFAHELPPATGSRVHGLPRLRMVRRRLDGEPQGAAGARRAGLHLRGPSRLVAPQGRQRAAHL